MPVFAFLVFRNENEKAGLKALAKAGLFKSRLGTSLFRLFNNKKFGKAAGAVKTETEIPEASDHTGFRPDLHTAAMYHANGLIGPGLGAVPVELPFPRSLLPLFNLRSIGRFIEKLCVKNGWERCFISGTDMTPGELARYSADTGNRDRIFKALLLPMLDAIYTKNGIRLDDLEITIISGESVSELLTVVMRLEPYVRYINVAAADKESVESALSGFCADSGLSVFVGGDLRSILRDADLIINLDCEVNLSGRKIKSGALFINLVNADNRRLQGDYTVINGLAYNFRSDIYSRLGKEICRCFGKAELSELLMAIKAGLLAEGPVSDDDGESEGSDGYSPDAAGAVLKVFKNDGCAITGLVGRHGILGGKWLH